MWHTLNVLKIKDCAAKLTDKFRHFIHILTIRLSYNLLTLDSSTCFWIFWYML